MSALRGRLWVGHMISADRRIDELFVGLPCLIMIRLRIAFSGAWAYRLLTEEDEAGSCSELCAASASSVRRPRSPAYDETDGKHGLGDRCCRHVPALGFVTVEVTKPGARPVR
jgi:hypothetical protein